MTRKRSLVRILLLPPFDRFRLCEQGEIVSVGFYGFEFGQYGQVVRPIAAQNPTVMGAEAFGKKNKIDGALRPVGGEGAFFGREQDIVLEIDALVEPGVQFVGCVQRDIATVKISAKNRGAEVVGQCFAATVLYETDNLFYLTQSFAARFVIQVQVEQGNLTTSRINLDVQATFAAQATVLVGESDVLIEQDWETGNERIAIVERDIAVPKIVCANHGIGIP